MCGSGTFLVEAADMALNRAPGRARTFGFEKLNGFVPARWRTLQDEAHAAERPARRCRSGAATATARRWTAPGKTWKPPG